MCTEAMAAEAVVKAVAADVCARVAFDHCSRNLSFVLMHSPSFAQLRHDARAHIPLHNARFERAVHAQEVVGAVRIASACLARCGRTQAFQKILPVTQSLARDANHLERVLFTIGIHSRFCDLVGELLVEVVFAGRSARSGLGHNGLFPLVILVDLVHLPLVEGMPFRRHLRPSNRQLDERRNTTDVAR